MEDNHPCKPDTADALPPYKLSEVLERMPEEDRGSMWVWSYSNTEEEFHCHMTDGFDDLVRGLKCFKFENSAPITEVRIIERDKIDAWLAEPIPERNGERPCAGFRILQAHQPSACHHFPLDFATYEGLRKEFKLPPVERHLNTEEQGASGLFEQDDGSFVIVQRRTHIIGLGSTVLRYDPGTNLTEGYLLIEYPLNDDQTEYPLEKYHRENIEHISHIAQQYLSCPHPLLIPTLTKEDEFRIVMGSISANHNKLQAIESLTGFTEYKVEDEDYSKLDHRELVEKLSILHSNYAYNQTALNTFRSTAAFLKESVQVMRDELPTAAKDNLARSSKKLDARIKYLQSSLEHGYFWGNMPMRMDAQQSVLFNLISQADTRINISVAKASRELAAASKQDSSAMKIIAFLTTIYLPGTFLSSFFAMPLFDWSKPHILEAPEPHYWFYWAITIPLTLLTMAVAIAWGTWRARKTMSQVREARRGTEAEKAAEAQLLASTKSDTDHSHDSSHIPNDEDDDEGFQQKDKAHRQINLWDNLMRWRRGRVGRSQGGISRVRNEGGAKARGLGRRGKRRNATEEIEMRDVEAIGVQVEAKNHGHVVNRSRTL